jgi:outer membrane protein insertion porin family
VPGTSDQLDVNVKVTEKPTGNLMLGVGTSSTDKVIVSGSIAQNNFMGSGNNVSIQVNSASSGRTYALSYTNPYFTTDGVSQGFDIYHRTMDTSTLSSTANYKSTSTGGGIRFGFPINEFQSWSVGIAADTTTIDLFDNSPDYYEKYVESFGKTNISFPLTLAWVSDSKNSFFFPSKGTYQRAGLEVGLPGGDLTYYRANYQLQHFIPLSKQFTLLLGGDLGYASGYAGKGLPFFKNYYAGGVGSVRGYKGNSLGSTQTIDEDGNRVGGNRKLVANAELLWSLPGFEKSARLGVFFDAGQIYASNDKFAISDLRYSTGLSAAWISPIGPLKFSIGRPLNKKSSDETESFQFQLGTTF